MSRTVTRSAVKIGDRVTVKVREQVGREDLYMEPGHVGIVGSIRVPYVYEKRPGEDRSTEFVCVDFFVEGQTHDPRYPWIYGKRCRPDYKNIVVLPDDTPVTNLPAGKLEQSCGSWTVDLREVS